MIDTKENGKNWIPIVFTEAQWRIYSFQKRNRRLPLAIIADWKKEISPDKRNYDANEKTWYFHPVVLELARRIMRRHDTDPKQGRLI